MYLIGFQAITYAQRKLIRIFGQRLRRRLKFEPHLILPFRHQPEIHVARKTVLPHFVLASVHAEMLVPQAPNYRKKDRRMPLPKRRIRLPQKLAPKRIPDTRQLRPMKGDI